MIDQTFALEIVGEDMGLRIIYGQTVLGGHPQTAVDILDDALDATEGQTVVCGQGFEDIFFPLSSFLFPPIQAVTIAA